MEVDHELVFARATYSDEPMIFTHAINPDLLTASQAFAQQGLILDPSTVAIRHRTDVVGQVFFALHSDVEVPCGCCIFQAGVRVEWDYTWSDILQRQNDSNMQDLNVMINLGIRF